MFETFSHLGHKKSLPALRNAAASGGTSQLENLANVFTQDAKRLQEVGANKSQSLAKYNQFTVLKWHSLYELLQRMSMSIRFLSTESEFRITSLREIHSTCIHVPQYRKVLFGNTKGCPPQTPELEAPPACTAELTVPQESTVQQLPFEWWHQRITSRLKSQNHLL